MQKRVFGNTGVLVPCIGQGTWRMESDERQQAIAALRAGIELGMTHIDTAELYGSGAVEELVAEAIAGRRDELFLVSKVMPSNASRRGTVQACERSLKRLRVSHLDCYLLHWPGHHPLDETIEAFEELVRKGKIKHYGVSNFDERELAQAVAIAGPDRIACNQVLYHLEERQIEHAVLPDCEKDTIAVVGYTPFGTRRFPPEGNRGKLRAESAARHAATPRQVALAFLTRKPSLFAIPKASNPSHTQDNAGAGSLVLTAPELDALDKAFARGPKRAGIPMI